MAGGVLFLHHRGSQPVGALDPKVGLEIPCYNKEWGGLVGLKL